MDASLVRPEYSFLPASASFDTKISDVFCWWESLLLLLVQKKQNESHKYYSLWRWLAKEKKKKKALIQNKTSVFILTLYYAYWFPNRKKVRQNYHSGYRKISNPFYIGDYNEKEEGENITDFLTMGIENCKKKSHSVC